MSKDDYIYHPFGKGPRPVLKVLLRKKARHQAEGVEEAKVGPEYGVLPGAAPADELILSVRGITFYDLATRKNEDGTYRDLWPYLSPPLPDASYDWWTTYHTLLLQGDFKKSCLQIPNAAQYLYFDGDLLPSNLDLDSKRSVVGLKAKRPYIQDIGVIAAPNADTTKWRQARLPFSPPADMGDWFLSVESAFYYNGFFTQDPNDYAQPFYKITSTPDPSGPAISLAIKGQEKVFLTPVLTSAVVSTGPIRVRVSRRLPVMPKFSPQALPLALLGSVLSGTSVELRARASAELWAALSAYYAPLYPALWNPSAASIPIGAALEDLTIDGLVSTAGVVTDADMNVTTRNGFLGYDLMAHPRTLVAVIVQQAHTYYVWQNSVQSQELRVVHGEFVYRPGPDVFPGAPRVFWPRTRIYHP